MYNSSGRLGEDPREDSALRAILRLMELDDGSGIVLSELEATLAGLDTEVRQSPSVRVAALPFLAELRLGLGDDEPVARMLRREAAAAAGGDDAARVVVLRTLRALARMDAVELAGVVKQLANDPDIALGGDPVLFAALDLAGAALDAVGPGAHPLAYTRLPARFADRVLLMGDPELLCFFADVEIAVHARVEDDRRIADELAGNAPAEGDFGDRGAAV